MLTHQRYDLPFVSDLRVGQENQNRRTILGKPFDLFQHVAQRWLQFCATGRAQVGQFAKTIVGQQNRRGRRFGIEILKGGFEEGHGHAIFRVQYFDTTVQSLDGLLPFLSLHAAGSVHEKVNILRHGVGRFHAGRGAKFQQRVIVAMVTASPATQRGLGSVTFLPAEGEIAIRNFAPLSQSQAEHVSISRRGQCVRRRMDLTVQELGFQLAIELDKGGIRMLSIDPGRSDSGRVGHLIGIIYKTGTTIGAQQADAGDVADAGAQRRSRAT